MVVVEAVIDDTDLDAGARVVLPRVGDIDAACLAGQSPLLNEIGVGWQRGVTSRWVERLPMDRNVVQHRGRGALAGARRAAAAGAAGCATCRSAAGRCATPAGTAATRRAPAAALLSAGRGR